MWRFNADADPRHHLGRALRSPTLGMMCLLIVVALTATTKAQAPPGCWTSSGGTWWTTIVLKTDDKGVCVVDPYGGQYHG